MDVDVKRVVLTPHSGIASFNFSNTAVGESLALVTAVSMTKVARIVLKNLMAEAWVDILRGECDCEWRLSVSQLQQFKPKSTPKLAAQGI